MQVAWLRSTVLVDWVAEAEQHYPLETGGVLIGYWADMATAVVTHLVGAGPRSTHRRWSYVHDHEWEASQIALHYERSGRSETYIGDWHTHPDSTSGNLSLLDKKSLRRVITSPAARAPRLLITVVFGEPRNWTSAVWVAEIKRRRLLGSKLVLLPLAPRTFEDFGGQAEPQ